MATISDPFLFRWDSVDQLGDLERLQLVLDALPDEPLMQLLEADRGHGRNDYPVRPMWNSLIAACVFQHPSIAALRRELLRNGQLRDSCGFDPFAGAAAVPTECAYTRFQRRLRKYQPQIEELFHSTLDEPLAFEVTEASRGEQPQAQWLLDQMQERHPELLERCSRLSADKGYDDHKLINRLWDEHQIKPIIAIRNCWKDGDAEDNGVRTKLVNGQENVIYTYNGEVSCMCPLSGEVHSMTYGGFERDRETLKYRCPARYSGITCKGMEQCPLAGKAVRIPLAEDRRVFTPVARSSYRWQDYYDERSAVERVNSRLAGGFGFERPGIRGLAKMQLRITMALTIMLAMALGRIRAGQPEHLRSLVKPAA